MTRPQGSQFGRLVRGLACAATVGSSLLVPGFAAAVEPVNKNTVFKTPEGVDWIVSIKPARRTAQAEARTVAVPAPVDVVPVAAVAQQVPPPEPPLETVAPGDLPPVPVMTTGRPGTGATTAHGVTVVPSSQPQLEVFGRRYVDAYRSIPFNRAEYNANPSYRHEAAMELLFGQMRPTTIVKQMPEPKDDEPVFTPYRPFIPAYGDYSLYQSLPFRYPLFQNYNLPNGGIWPTY